MLTAQQSGQPGILPDDQTAQKISTSEQELARHLVGWAQIRIEDWRA
jgi:hypothetical protein